jgi:hypothetical protein
MNNELRDLIVELLKEITDTDLLDLVYKILLESVNTNSILE